MKRILNIEDKILTEKPEIHIGDKVYIVDDRKRTVDEMMKVVDKENGEKKAVELTLGKEAAKEIEAMDLSMTGYNNLIIAIMAAVMDLSFEEAEERFRKATKQ